MSLGQEKKTRRAAKTIYDNVKKIFFIFFEPIY